MAHDTKLLIDGKLVDAASGKTFDNINPATEEVLGSVADAGQEDMDAAIAAARRAFDTTDWATNKELRKRCLEQLNEALESEREEFRAEIIAEVGSPVMLTYGPQLDVPLADALRWPAKYIDEFEWERDLGVAEFMGSQSQRKVVKEPVGVVGAITPWNYPLEVILNKIGQALATGNTVVLKPAPDTPFNATRLARLAAERTDLPPGVFNVINSSDHMRGEQLVTDPRVDLISFTGSTAVGQRIMEKGSATLKRLFLELGGKSANILLDDADFDASIAMSGFGTCAHAGQGCVMTMRWLIPRSRFEQSLEAMKAAFEAVPYGDPTDMGNVMGPVINAKQRDRVLGLVETARKEGDRIITGGGRPAHLPKGWFVEPTLIACEDNSHTIAQTEVFGPVLTVIPYEDDDDAVRIANDSMYGLGGSVSSASLDRAMNVARRIRAGVITVNGGNWYGGASPFGGYKMSGIGRQNGREGFEQYTETKTYGLPV